MFAYATLCHTMPFYATLCHTMPDYAVLCYCMPGMPPCPKRYRVLNIALLKLASNPKTAFINTVPQGSSSRVIHNIAVHSALPGIHVTVMLTVNRVRMKKASGPEAAFLSECDGTAALWPTCIYTVHRIYLLLFPSKACKPCKSEIQTFCGKQSIKRRNFVMDCMTKSDSADRLAFANYHGIDQF